MGRKNKYKIREPPPEPPILNTIQQQPKPELNAAGDGLIPPANKLKQPSDARTEIPRGTVGTSGIAETNYLKLDLSNMSGVAYHYDVTISNNSDCIPKKLKRSVFEKFVDLHFPNYTMAFDGYKSVYSHEKLPDYSFETEIDYFASRSSNKKFKILIKETENLEIDLNLLRTYYRDRVFDKPMRALQCIDVILGTPCQNKGVHIARSYYTKPSKTIDLKNGYEMWLGLHQSAILGNQPYLNVDICHKSFPMAAPILEYIQTNYKDNLNQELKSTTWYDVNAYVRKLLIVYEPPAVFGSNTRTYRSNGISVESARKLTFNLGDGKMPTIEEYFKNRGYNLRYPNLPCIDTSSSVKKIYLPIELCKIKGGQTTNRKDDGKQVQQLIKHSITKTDERKQRIMAMLDHFEHNKNKTISKFGISIEFKFIEVPLRVLPKPLLQYSNDVVNVDNGTWRLNPKTYFFHSKHIRSGFRWCIMYKSNNRSFGIHKAHKFVKDFQAVAKSQKVCLQENPHYQEFTDIDKTFKEIAPKKYDIVFVILPNEGTTYEDVKKSAELKHGILTQCIKEKTLTSQVNDSWITNLLLKVNTKLNGINHKVYNSCDILPKQTMIFGADVTHPSSDHLIMPSIVGVVSSFDSYGLCYYSQLRLQQSTVENIEDMESIFCRSLDVYKMRMGFFPKQVIYYRDGVSDGQFPIVEKSELAAMRAACKKKFIVVKITCIIVVKRHHTRFFPIKPTGKDKYNNVEPGTVVDQIIVHPNEKQFFMVSHKSVQGTARPSRYNVIVDDANINIDDLQILTYNLCYLFPRCNRSVSCPTPAYLAHLAAYRGRVYIDGEKYDGKDLEALDRRLSNMHKVMPNNPMYFV